MGRLNITLERDTLNRIDEHARSEGKARAAIARELLVAGLDRVERMAKLEKLARDYSQGRQETTALLSEIEVAQLELLDD